MNALSAALTLVLGVLLVTLPRRLASIPLLLGAAYLTRGAELELGPAHFTVVRILVVIGVCRVLVNGERIAGGMNNVDRMLLLWATWLIASSMFHAPDAWVYRAGLVWSDLGCYFLFRVFVRNWEDVRRIFKVVCILLVPVAVLMMLEKLFGENFFVAVGGYSEAIFRDGRFRARGPFAHPILAGTVGAACFPMAVYLWKRDRIPALLGFFSAAGIVFASNSSGPVVMALFSVFGLLLWKVRRSFLAIRWLALTGVIVLDLIMKDPVYFLMARVDITGSSTGWYRARLIQSSIEHLDEWWLTGTDYTRHWMPTGIYANATSTDITNHLLGMGVMGGLPLMLLLILTLVAAFRAVGRALRQNESASSGHQFLAWTLGTVLFAHVMNFFSISLFDQSIVFYYLVLAAIGAIWARTRVPASSRISLGRRCSRPVDGYNQGNARA